MPEEIMEQEAYETYTTEETQNNNVQENQESEEYDYAYDYDQDSNGIDPRTVAKLIIGGAAAGAGAYAFGKKVIAKVKDKLGKHEESENGVEYEKKVVLQLPVRLPWRVEKHVKVKGKPVDPPAQQGAPESTPAENS